MSLEDQPPIESLDKTSLIKRIQELEAENRRLEVEAKKLEELLAIYGKDPLTGFDNRLLFEEKANQALSDLRRLSPNTPIAFVFIDANGFKSINDNYGHEQGDEAIKLIAEALKQTFSRESDVIGRRGGDEFYGFLPDTSESGSLHLINMLHQNFANLIEKNTNLKESNLTLSVGIVLGNPRDNFKELEGNADLAMFKAKEAHYADIQRQNGTREERDRFGKTAYYTNGQIQLALG